MGREEFEVFNNQQILDSYGSERILVIGAGGTIGSAIARRLFVSGVRDVYMLDRDESSLHALALSLSDVAASHSERYIVGDIRDKVGIRNYFESLRPTVVLHAAALKHLVMLERFPREGYMANIVGTKNLLEASVQYGVKRFINISTDKAANPTSVLGKTKRIAEFMVHEFAENFHLSGCSVRFGNVFASRGSVIETFIHQIKHELPVSITHPQVTRFFMSSSEAANLVLLAGSMKKSSTLIQNMGSSVLITDIVNNLGKFLGKNPKVVFIGLQPGEKMNEELVDGDVTESSNENIVELVHPIKTSLTGTVDSEIPVSDREALVFIDQLVAETYS